MLARLQLSAGVSHASVDYGGTHLRLTLDGPLAFEPAVALLRELGFDPAVVDPAHATPGRWYDLGSVTELSAIEADVIAARVVGKFSLRRRLARDTQSRVRTAVATALLTCFSDRDASPEIRPEQFRVACLQAAVAAARELLDDAQIVDFIDTLDADLAEDHTHDAGL